MESPLTVIPVAINAYFCTGQNTEGIISDSRYFSPGFRIITHEV
jgi:hypothetical protein